MSVPGFVVGLGRLLGLRRPMPIIVVDIDPLRTIPVPVVIVWIFSALSIWLAPTIEPIVAAVVCALGPSGSGKSTPLKCADLLEPFRAGPIVLDGAPRADPAGGTRKRQR